MLHEIKKIFSGELLFSLECESLRLCVEAAILSKANLSGANLSGANLSGANLSGANLSGVNLSEANLSWAILSKADLSWANLSGVNLSEANLSEANLSRADLFAADLFAADLSEANLYRANLFEANLSRADLIDGGQDKRGFRFWAWQRNDGHVVYRAGCREWVTYDDAVDHFGVEYTGDGDKPECLARLELMRNIANAKWSV